MSAPHAVLSPTGPAGDELPRSQPERAMSPDGEQPERAMSPDGDFAADDLAALRLVTVPEVGPPFDGDPGTATTIISCDLAGYGRGFPADAIGAAQPAVLATRPAGRGGGKADLAGMARARETGQSQNCAEWPQQFARLLTEALAGARPVRQILPWTSERVRGHLHSLMPLFAGGQRPRVLRVITTRPTREVIEMTVVVGVGTRTRALAIRLEQSAARQLPSAAGRAAWDAKPTASAPRWLCTDIEAA